MLAELSKAKIWTEHASQDKTTCGAKMFARAVAFRNTGGSWPSNSVHSTFFLECVPESDKNVVSVFSEMERVLINIQVLVKSDHGIQFQNIFFWLKIPGCPL